MVRLFAVVAFSCSLAVWRRLNLETPNKKVLDILCCDIQYACHCYIQLVLIITRKSDDKMRETAADMLIQHTSRFLTPTVIGGKRSSKLTSSSAMAERPREA